MAPSNRLLWVVATCLGLAALVACSPVPADGTPAQGAESPESGTATPMPVTTTDSPLPTAGSETPLPGLVPSIAPGATAPLELAPGFTPEAKPLPEIVPELTPRPPVTGQVPAGILDAILADLAGRLGLRSDDIEVLRGESVTWSDGSLGCPEPGMMYTQALVDGYWVVLEHSGNSYDYRATVGGYFRLCENPEAVPPGLPGGSGDN